MNPEKNMRNRICCRIAEKKRGYALLLSLLLVVVIGMIVYFKWMYGPVYQIGKGQSGINPPWRQWEKLRIRIEQEPVGKPKPEQNQILKPLLLETKCKLDGKELGELQLLINSNGKIEGGWAGSFYIDKDVDFQIMVCSFEGTIDPQEIYSDIKGEDNSKLFYIAKGPFSILETNNKTGIVRNLMGSVYVRGWLAKDNSVSGELIITSDDKNFYLFDWQGKAKVTSELPKLRL